MTQEPVLFTFDDLQIYGRQFQIGAQASVEDQGISVIIDVFRASNTMLELMEAGAKVHPVTSVDEALDPKFNGYIKIGEDEGSVLSEFDYDNSPVAINQNAPDFKGQDVVIRTTNGTRGILSAVGSRKILVGTYRNMSAVIEVCIAYHKQGIPISFIGMGTLEQHRIEDEYCTKMFVIKMLEHLDEADKVQLITDNDDNPWVRQWRQEIMNIRGKNTSKLADYQFSLELNTTNIVPEFDPAENKLIHHKFE